jgi:hypothetical protein
MSDAMTDKVYRGPSGEVLAVLVGSLLKCSKTRRRWIWCFEPSEKDDPGMTKPTVSTSAVHTIEKPPMFPSSVSVGGASITLNADGSWTGDASAFYRALADAKQDGSPLTMPILWMFANAIRNSRPGN